MAKVTLHKVKRPTQRAPNRRVWMLRWYDTHGKRCGETIGEVGKVSKRDAEATRHDREVKMDMGVVKRDRPEKISLSEFIRRDREAIQADVKPTTLLEYDHAANHALKALGGEILLSQIGRAEVGRIKKHLADLGRRPATIRKTMTALGALMRRAEADGLIHENPFNGAAKGKTQSKTARIFRPEEINAMLSVTPTQWWRVFLKLAVTSGLRVGELLNLHWRDIDFNEKTVTVSRKDAGRFTVGDRDYPILPWETKAHEARTVPLPSDTISALKRFRLTSGGSVYVFLSLDRLAAIDARMEAETWPVKSQPVNNLIRDFKVIQTHARGLLAKQRKVKLEKVDWPIGTIHDLRRTYATEMASHVDLLTLTRWLGHADPKTTQVFYHRVRPETEVRARRALSDLYGRNRTHSGHTRAAAS